MQRTYTLPDEEFATQHTLLIAMATDQYTCADMRKSSSGADAMAEQHTATQGNKAQFRIVQLISIKNRPTQQLTPMQGNRVQFKTSVSAALWTCQSMLDTVDVY